MRTLLFILGLSALGASLQAATPHLLPNNLSAPFCYVHGGTRRWPVTDSPLQDTSRVHLKAARDNQELAQGERLRFTGLEIALSREGWLEIQSAADAKPVAFQLEIKIDESGHSETQRLEVRAAPPPRPISYIADFGDDLIDLFFDRSTGRWRPMEKGAFDQYFRRLQAHGVGRLIVWQSPFPYMADPKNYPEEDWQRYAAQARAILDSPELTAALEKPGDPASWNWLRYLMQVRLMPEFGKLLTRSAAEHGIKLTASFRPFEMALDKYYAVPAFDESGAFLWNFHPAASPAVDYHAETVGFAHYREVLEAMGKGDAGQLAAVEIKGVTRPEGLRVVATPYPPMQADSFVLVRDKTGGFQLRPFREIQKQAESRCRELTNFAVESSDASLIRITGINMPADCRFLVVSKLAAAADAATTLFARAGNKLGRVNAYWAAAAGDAKTRVGAITKDGGFWSLFNAVEASAKAGPKGELLVIDLGDPWSVEMVDFNQPAARWYAIDELRTILNHPPFDEIFINTRSHTSLAATMADGADGLKPIAHYSAPKRPYVHLGLDRAYAPRGAADDARLRSLAADRAGVEKITTWQPGEWDGTCQSADSPFAWRYARNRGVADGVRRLLEDLEAAFPQTRIRAVIPERGPAVANILEELDRMPKPGGGVYGREYYRHLWASINHIPAIGEGMTLLDLKGLRVEPVFGGIRFLPDRGPFDVFVREVIADLRGNLGSSFTGPRSFFYEGHETRRTTDPAVGRLGREERIRHLLNQRGEVKEVILYEAAAWLGLPLNDPDLCGHGFLDRPAPAK